MDDGCPDDFEVETRPKYPAERNQMKKLGEDRRIQVLNFTADFDDNMNKAADLVENMLKTVSHQEDPNEQPELVKGILKKYTMAIYDLRKSTNHLRSFSFQLLEEHFWTTEEEKSNRLPQEMEKLSLRRESLRQSLRQSLRRDIKYDDDEPKCKKFKREEKEGNDEDPT